jgi:hypothetical protein
MEFCNVPSGMLYAKTIAKVEVQTLILAMFCTNTFRNSTRITMVRSILLNEQQAG